MLGNTRTGINFELKNGAATVAGTFSSLVLRNKDFMYNTATVVKIMDIAAGTTLSVEATRYKGGASVKTAQNGSSLLIEKL